MKYKYIILYLLIVSSTSVLAEVTWTTYPSYVTAIAVEGDYIWLGIENEVIVWNIINRTPGVYKLKQRLNCNRIYSIVIDDSVMWFGTDMGLMRFDGKMWKTYTTEDGLIDNVIVNVAVDYDGTVWAGTQQGVSSFDGEKWINYSTENGLIDNDVIKIAVDHNNFKWFVTHNGLSRYDNVSWNSYTIENGLEGNIVSGITIDLSNRIFVGTGYQEYIQRDGNSSYNREHRFLQSFDGSIWTTHVSKITSDSVVPHAYNPLTVDDNNVLWYNYTFSFWSYDGENNKLYKFSPDADGPALNAYFDSQGIMWLLMSNGLLQSFDGSKFETYEFGPTGFSHDSKNTRTISVDKNNTKWIGGHYGIARFDDYQWQTSRVYSNFNFAGSSIFASALEESGILWLAYGDIVARYDGTTWTRYETELPHKHVRAIAIDHDNVKWFGFGEYWDGVLSFDGIEWITYTNLDDSDIDGVVTIAVDNNNVKWFGYGRNKKGVIGFDGNEVQEFTSFTGPIYERVYAIAVDLDNVKWFGTGSGIYSFDGTLWKKFTTDDGLVGNYVKTIAVGNDNTKWIGTNKGMSRFDGILWKTYTDQDGLIDNNVQTIAVDLDDVIWVGTEKGIVSFKDDGTPTIVEEPETVPNELKILANYPNPFNPYTAIQFIVPREGFTTLLIYNLAGQKVKELVAGHMSSGVHSVVWNGKDEGGAAASSGIYLTRLTSNGHNAFGRMVLLK